MRPGLACGYGETAITPPRGADLCGYGFYLDRKAERVMDPLKARALRLGRDGAGVLIVSCDLIGLTTAFSDLVRDEIGRRLGLPRSAVLLACTHTHSGPATHSLPGLGRPLPGYMESLRRKIVEAAVRADHDVRPARASWAIEAIEPIGYNRRTGDFRGIDADLKTVVFERPDGRIHLWSYACHAVVLGPTKSVSADWPGAAIRALETTSRRGVFLQGFSGDVDPVCQRNRWGQGTPDDLVLYGALAAARLIKAERFAQSMGDAVPAAAESRVDLPLQVYGEARIRSVTDGFAEAHRAFPGGRRFAADWRKRALGARAAANRDPFVRGVPVQAIRLGPVRIGALPGEIFSAYAAPLRKAFDPLLPVGLANGVAGYVPTKAAYADPKDYAAWCAPMIYGVFPFRPEAGGRLATRLGFLLRRAR